ncbi:hypothetical protein [Ectopseudomonas khazarica]|uniref:hypothetical protein n=1 Tax=Ectopseudomonas khazarica TaxID=2502979 RepID=UPI001FCF9E6B|nr:hypothetical protein [Pseudomonas khazarica]
MPRIDVVSLVGSAVPAELRSDGLMACWLLMVDGQPKAVPLRRETLRLPARLSGC